MVDISSSIGVYFNLVFISTGVYMIETDQRISSKLLPMPEGAPSPASAEETITALKEELERERQESSMQSNKFWQLIARSNCVVGEGHFTDEGLSWNFIGDKAPDAKLGLKKKTIPSNTDELLILMHPDDHEQYLQSLNSAQSSGGPWDVTYRLSDGHGEWRWIYRRGVSLGLSDGIYRDWIFFAEDITAQMNVKATLSQSLKDLDESRIELNTAQDRLWKLAANTFSLLGEAHLTEDGMKVVFFGDVPPAEETGDLRGGGFFKRRKLTVDDAS